MAIWLVYLCVVENSIITTELDYHVGLRPPHNDIKRSNDIDRYSFHLRLKENQGFSIMTVMVVPYQPPDGGHCLSAKSSARHALLLERLFIS